MALALLLVMIGCSDCARLGFRPNGGKDKGTAPSDTFDAASRDRSVGDTFDAASNDRSVDDTFDAASKDLSVIDRTSRDTTCCAPSCPALQDDINNCGACGRACQFNHSTGQCTKGSCVIAQCDSLWGSCDNVDENGCETSLNTAVNCASCGQTCDKPDQACCQGYCMKTAAVTFSSHTSNCQLNNNFYFCRCSCNPCNSPGTFTNLQGTFHFSGLEKKNQIGFRADITLYCYEMCGGVAVDCNGVTFKFVNPVSAASMDQVVDVKHDSMRSFLVPGNLVSDDGRLDLVVIYGGVGHLGLPSGIGNSAGLIKIFPICQP